MSQVLRAEQRSQRRAARREASRADILDAAETVFGEDGLRAGSLRRIADVSGYSTAAIYLFFDNKQHLVTETINRRADEYLDQMRDAARIDGSALDRLHHIVDAASQFFAARPGFRKLMRQLEGGSAIAAPLLDGFADDPEGRYANAMTLMAELISDGQASGDIRAGDPAALAHFASVLTNEYVLLEPSAAEPGAARLTPQQFHALFDGALRGGAS
jgi:AcrR family transcriptional regulator